MGAGKSTLTVRSDQPDGTPSPGVLSSRDVLAEPPRRSGQWMAGVVRRLVAASARPIAAGALPRAHAERLERAGWFVASGEADLEAARDACWPAARDLKRLGMGVGSLAPRLVFVGERETRPGQIPFASRSGTWLFLALREMGHDELSCYLTNALTSEGRRKTSRLRGLRDALAAYEPTWIALGRESERVLRAADIPHVHVMHPAAHRRYHYAEDVAGYVRRLREAGLEDGPGIPEGSLVEVEELPELSAPYDVTSVAFVKGKSSRPSGKGSGGRTRVSVVKAQRARRAYVTGEAATLAEAARLVDVHPDGLREVARSEGWEAEREDHQRQLTEEAKAAAIRAEARAASNARRLAWAGTEMALAQLVRRLRAGELQVRPAEAKSIADCALSLTDRVSDPDESREELRGRSLRELVEDVRARFEQGLGGGN